MDNNKARNRRNDRESLIGYSSVPDSNGDTGVYVIPDIKDDTPFIIEAIAHYAGELGLAPDARFSDFGPQVQSLILQHAARLKEEEREARNLYDRVTRKRKQSICIQKH